ncbi:MAG: sugar ABC transporter permease [Ruminococcaceae bacterium]|nr:sugar ABC transporter permease [Oscillospiraceae bacterium]
MKRSRLSLTARQGLTGFCFCIPFVLGFLMFFLKPLIQSLIFAFSKVSVSLDGYSSQPIGFENFQYIFTKDATFSVNLMDSFTNLLWQVPVIVVFSLFFAIILNQKFTGRTMVRAIFFLPVIVASGLVMDIIQSDAAASSALSGSVVAAGSTTQTDVLREILVNSGLSSKFVNAITTVVDSLFSLTWKTGIQTIIFLAGLQSVPSSLYEAAYVEGCSGWESFWKITLPMLMPIMQLNLVYSIVDNFTDTKNKVMVQVMNNARLVRYGWTSAMSWTYFVIIAVVLAVVFIVFHYMQRERKTVID